MGGFEYKERSRELHVYNQGLVELQQMTANPVRGSQPAALESSAPFGLLIKSPESSRGAALFLNFLFYLNVHINSK